MSNNNNYSSFASSLQGWYGPQLQVTYTPQANDNVIKLKWPLATSYASRVVTQSFGVDWAGGSECPVGVIKKHNGVDYRATAGTAVYAPEDGWIKHVELHSPWAYHIVIEHNHPVSGKFTTVLWHVTPLSGISDGVFIPKGMRIATVANLATGPHLHFGLRIGSYASAYLNGTPFAGTGGLPQNNCQDNPPSGPWYPAFSSSGFVSPESTSNVLFQ